MESIILKAADECGNVFTVFGNAVKFTADGSDESVIVDDARIVMDNGKEPDFGENFHGHRWSADEVAAQLVRGYINGDKTWIYSEVEPGVASFRNNFNHGHADIELKDGSVVPARYLDSYDVLELEMVDNDHCSYYSNGDVFILLRSDRSIATDMEVFYGNSMLENIENGTYLYRKGE